jgi:ribosome-binding protein aMBF1 (putative translation factor)
MRPGTRIQEAIKVLQAEALQAVADASMQIGKTKNLSMAKMIVDERERLNLSLQEVANRAGITKSHMWEMEQGRAVNPTIGTVHGIAKALGIPFVELAAGALNDMERSR